MDLCANYTILHQSNFNFYVASPNEIPFLFKKCMHIYIFLPPVETKMSLPFSRLAPFTKKKKFINVGTARKLSGTIGNSRDDDCSS